MKKTTNYDLSNLKYVDYKDLDLLKLFLTPHGQIQGKRRTCLTSKQQRAFATAVKRARFMGLLPYIAP
jgi:small subunit ribosomal protein S18